MKLRFLFVLLIVLLSVSSCEHTVSGEAPDLPENYPDPDLPVVQAEQLPAGWGDMSNIPAAIPDGIAKKSVIQAFDISDSDPDTTISTTAGADAVIILADNASSVSGSDTSGVAITGNVIKITKEGTYALNGSLSNGKVIVDVNKQVFLVLNGVSITSNDGSPLAIFNSKKKVVTLAAGTENVLTDAITYSYIYDGEGTGKEPNGALFSQKALTINGTGSLQVTGRSNNGISCKGDLKIMSGTIRVNSPDNALKGNDSIVIKGGTITLNSAEDGMKTNTDDADAKKLAEQLIYIENATLNVTAGKDGIQAYEAVWIKGANTNITVKTGGGSTGSVYEGADSLKAIKAALGILIEGGTINLDARDDAIHSNDTVIISGGNINIKTDDDGIHGDELVLVEGGAISVTQSYEGLEAAKVVIKNGSIILNASDDGISASIGEHQASSEAHVIFAGGNTRIHARGDGVDANGSILFTGGEFGIVHYGSRTEHEPIDTDLGWLIRGGTLYAASDGDFQWPLRNEELQKCILFVFNQKDAGTRFVIKDLEKNIAADWTPDKAFSRIMMSSPGLNGDTNEVYSLYINTEKVKSFTLPYQANKLDL
ncbi:hypothetical protein AGMMS50268_39370 [Spirochaetia bacterium]|nr:hypothetical protein AGMMS50268_39370 [Spirochaetia bacterium]